MCEWCVRFNNTKHSHRWRRHFYEWGWGYQKRHISSMWTGLKLKQSRKIVYIKRNEDKPTWCSNWRYNR